MLEDDDLFAAAFEEGRRAARIGQFVTTNPYLDLDSVELTAWVEGFASVNTAELIPQERARIFREGENAAKTSLPAFVCPYGSEDNPERMEIWLMGYVPHAELIEVGCVQTT